jgi:hypothetical protein
MPKDVSFQKYVQSQMNLSISNLSKNEKPKMQDIRI